MWEAFGDDFVLYHRPSGKTHLLNESSHVLLTETVKESVSFAAILESLGINTDDPDAAAKVSSLWSLLVRLEEFGLLRQTNPDPS